MQRKLDQLDSVALLSELHVPPGNNLEALHGNRKGQYSIRSMNDIESVSVGYRMKQVLLKLWITSMRNNGEE